MSEHMMKIGENGPAIKTTAAMAANEVGAATRHLGLDVTIIAPATTAFDTRFGFDGLSISRRWRDWWQGREFHGLLTISRAKRSAILRDKLRSLLSVDTRESRKQAARIVQILTNNVWDTRPWDVAEAMWYESGLLSSGLGGMTSTLSLLYAQQALKALIEGGTLVQADAADGIPDSLLHEGKLVTFRNQLAADRMPGDGNFDSYTFAYDVALAFKPAIMRCFPAERSYPVPMPPSVETGYYDVPKERLNKYVDREVAKLQQYNEAGITTPEIIAEGTDYYVRGRVFGPRVDHIEDPFYGLAADDVKSARKAWQQVPDALVTAGLMVQPTANTFANRNAVYNLANSKWTVVRPLVSAQYQGMVTI